MTIEEIDLSSAVRIYTVSNTPLFLVRKLQADEVTRIISRQFSGEEILNALKKTMESFPQSPADYVKPYVYLVALQQLLDVKYLRSAEGLGNAEHWDWFKYIQQVLLETYSSLTTASYEPRKFSGFSSTIQLIEA